MTESNFEEIIASKKAVVVDFFATWCGPCQMMKPIVEETKEEFKDKEEIEILEIDIDENPNIAGKYKVMGVPTFMFFREGKEIDRTVGAASKDILTEKINQLIK